MSEKKGCSFNGQINEALRKVSAIERASMSELRSVFSPEEWKALADSLKGTLVNDVFRYSADALATHTEDSNLYESLGAKWEIDIKAMCDKIRTLSAAQVDALYRRIEDLWEHPETDIDEWAKF
jgi:hypothetical protein